MAMNQYYCNEECRHYMPDSQTCVLDPMNPFPVRKYQECLCPTNREEADSLEEILHDIEMEIQDVLNN
jgi:hypothetical protein